MVDVDTMPAGREMDELIAVKVMGWKRVAAFASFEVATRETKHYGESLVRPGGEGEADFVGAECPRYSTDIAAAWEVLMEIQRRTRFLRIIKDDREGPDMWFCVEWGGEKKYESSEGPLPVVACRAALKAVKA